MSTTRTNFSPTPGRGLAARGRALRDDERGAATAEYAITIMAAVGFAGLLVVILRSGEVQQILTDLVRNALTVAG
ncbi:DUF4244 domain-containing protein [uncultured Schumannella sp.]|uniref:DUF4244 domain-containing protein n=1 Tax=uncultured Schumannella sp. TaxID=1195956 RepID=UPI0025FDF10D|nr:DUF4244 domain-containing protein [uncultured Schumannella sp.]